MIRAKERQRSLFWQGMTSLWGVGLSSLAGILFVIVNPGIEQFKIGVVVAMLLTLFMLLNQRSRHFLLIPSGFAVLCALLAGANRFGCF
ncbi:MULTISPECIES: DUF1435 family protein [Photorhabdus]|uniref:DUF1435 family protein n=2 Tax=Photorhabdus TaxID=29487 RepID=A0A5B0WS26_9GAMM|nr:MULTISPECIES: DUF1435 family protein [Photorhabdus]KAA1189814.1 DUF1435 family protein [Photorhabdus heterorhabditis]KOY60353.1 hypothetical protein AM629_19820 [Photorhabdus heterorhabditis]MBS9442045.1 DUF1435 family protein [Photorhabdus heterorhabditis]NHB92319.1 DUF1435 domain-containing protein [Photorhabdus cinerea]NRN30150.1 DUF1435 family protein [Photorhabdus heterorhabditis subsp. aluminescens]